MVAPVPSFERVKEAISRVIGRPRRQLTESMVDVGATLRSFQPVTGRRGPGNVVEILPTDEIITRKGWSEYRSMLHDPQVTATLAFKKIMIYGRKWDVEPASEDQKDVDVAEFVRDALKKINLKTKIREGLSAFDYGFSLGELIWEVARVNGDQAIILKDIKFRDPEFVTVNVDKHGNVKSWIQDVRSFQFGNNKQEVELQPDKVFHYANNRTFSQHYGKSDLRAAYRSWWAKKFIVQFWNVFLERLGAPLTAARYPTGASTELKTALKNILKGLSSKTEILIPEGVEIELIEATRAGQASYDDALAYHDKEIARAMLMVALLGSGGNEVKRGSDSQSRLHLRTLHKMADEVGGDFMWELNQQVVKQLVDFNFDVEEYPKVFFQDYGEFEAFEITDAIRLLHAAGILELDQEDVNFARSILGMKVREEGNEDEVIRPPEPPPPASANAPPPPAAQGNLRAQGQPGGAGGGETPATSQ
jgi:phage gp29-like protein